MFLSPSSSSPGTTPSTTQAGSARREKGSLFIFDQLDLCRKTAGGPDCERLIRDIKVISNKVHRWLVCSGRYNLSHCDAGIHVKISEPEEIITAEITKILDECPAEPLEAKQDDTYAK